MTFRASGAFVAGKFTSLKILDMHAGDGLCTKNVNRGILLANRLGAVIFSIDFTSMVCFYNKNNHLVLL